MVITNKKLLINGRFLSQKPTGVQNYAIGIIKALIKSGLEVEIITPPCKFNNRGLPVKTIGLFSGFIWEQFFLAFYARRQQDNLLLNLCNSASLFIRRQIVTIHDLAFEEKANWFNPIFKFWYKFMIPRICRRALLIITVSGFSKRKIIEKYGIPESKIIIAPPGIPEFRFNNTIPNYRNYAVLTGANNPRKNAQWIINNLDILKKRDITLVVLGEISPTFQKISLDNNKSVVTLGNVSLPAYCALIKNAKTLIYPSLYEGFGIPILESICLGTPVIASDIPVFRESFGDIPEYFELNNTASFEKAIDKVSGREISDEDIKYLSNKFNYKFSASQILNSLNAIR